MEKQCHVCGQHSTAGRSMFVCPHCKITSYCSAEHRREDWRTHKRTCLGTTTCCPPVNDVEGRPNVIKLSDYQGTETLVEYIVRNLNEHDYCVIDDFHGTEFGLSVLEEVKSLHRQGLFNDGELASSSGKGKMDKKIREDQVSWVTGKESNCQAISQHMDVVDALISKCNLLIHEHDIKHRTKAMVACYPGKGEHYMRHIDNPHKDGRCITTLYYLNQNWKEENGGILQLYTKGREHPIKILPSLDRLLLFWSDQRNPHEVRPSYQTRYAITLWYFDTAERARYCQELREKASQEIKMESSKKEEGTPREVPRS